MLEKKVDLLLKESKLYQVENSKLKKELKKLKEKFGYEESEDFFNDPVIPGKARNSYTALGLALFSLVSVCMILGSNVNFQDASNLIKGNNNLNGLNSALDLSNPQELNMAF